MILHIPHSSRIIPQSERPSILLSDSDLNIELIAMTDAYTDDLFTSSVLEGDAVVIFPVSRLVVDPERFVDDELETMASRGMGVIYTKTSQENLLRNAPDEKEKNLMIASYYHPHHERLANAAEAELTQKGSALIVDCHSFPSVPLPYEIDQNPERPDICIGTDSFHTMPELVDAIVSRAREHHLSAEINRPFAGTIVPLKYYKKTHKVQSIMIEVNRRLYMNEKTGKKSRNYNETKVKLEYLIEGLRFTTADH